MGMSASSTGGRAGFPPFPDSAAGAFAFNRCFRFNRCLRVFDAAAVLQALQTRNGPAASKRRQAIADSAKAVGTPQGRF